MNECFLYYKFSYSFFDLFSSFFSFSSCDLQPNSRAALRRIFVGSEENCLCVGYMDHYPELSLGNKISFSESDESPSKKRKFQQNIINSTTKSSVFASMSSTPELPLKQNYLTDFHDLLQFGRRYNLSGNSTIMEKKSCNNNWMHKHQKLDLELSISNSDDDDERSSKSSEILEDASTKGSSTSNMFAMGCLRCNLLVMVSKSFPCCPNCKFVNSIPTNHYHDHRQSPTRKVAKSLHTLRLLH